MYTKKMRKLKKLFRYSINRRIVVKYTGLLIYINENVEYNQDFMEEL